MLQHLKELWILARQWMWYIGIALWIASSFIVPFEEMDKEDGIVVTEPQLSRLLSTLSKLTAILDTSQQKNGMKQAQALKVNSTRMAEADDEHDKYVAQLRQVFDSCDEQGTGQLNKSELEALCSRLQLEDQADALVRQLLGDDVTGRVGFETFKEGFVAVLSYTIESSDEEINEDSEDLGTTGGSISPKLLPPRKKYGRRSAPEVAGSDLEGTTDSADYTTSSRLSGARGFGSRVSSFDVEEPYETADGPDVITHKRPPAHPNSLKSHSSETFEADGQMNQNMCDLENALDPVSEEAHLREIWRELGVGQSGHISLEELGTVCEHIGMDEMSREDLEIMLTNKDPSELSHLFDKLDVDQDGQVSFIEFLQGLFQHGGPHTPSSMTPSSLTRATPNRPLSTPRMKLKLSQSLDGTELSRHTPSFTQLGSGLFSVIDPSNTGYASAEEICELWESLGIRQGTDILEFLHFDTRNKISLAELSHSLEQELRHMEEDNASYQAAVVTYEQELRHLKHVMEQKAAERDKLRANLGEAQARISLLVKEGDERQAALERAKEKEYIELEERCAEQMRGLQADMDTERETLIQQAAKQRAKLEQQIDRLKEEETKLRDTLADAQNAIERLEGEMAELLDKARELERQNVRMQRDLEQKDALQRRVEDLESNRANIIDEQRRFSDQKLQQLEAENKELKDKSDELTVEIEELTQRLSQSRRRHTPTPGGDKAVGAEVLPDSRRRDSVPTDSTSELSEDDGRRSKYRRTRRKLPERPANLPLSPTASHESDDLFSDEFAAKMAEIKASHSSELAHLQRGYSQERKEIEDAYKMEIAQLEDQHIREKNDVIKQLKHERDELEEDFVITLRASLAEKEESMREMHDEETRELIRKHESEQEHVQTTCAQEQAEVIERLREEFEEELENQLADEKSRHERELELIVSRDRDDSAEERKRVAQLELQLQLQSEELELSMTQKLNTLRQEYEADRTKLQEQHRIEILGYENMLTQGVVALKGKLREDFERLLEEHKSQQLHQENSQLQEEKTQLQEEQIQLQEVRTQLQKERTQLQDEASEERDQLVEDFTRQQKQLVQRYKQDKRDMEAKHKVQLQELDNQLSQQQNTAQAEKTSYQQQLEEIKDSATAEKQELQIRLEKLQKSAAAEKEQLQHRIRELQKSAEIEKERLQKQLIEGQERLRQEREQMRREFEEEKRHQQLDNSGRGEDSVRDRALLEQEISEELHAQFEDEFLEQMERLKEAFEEERSQLEGRIEMLQEEVEDINRTRDMEDRFRTQMETKNKEQQKKLKSQLDELITKNDDLHSEKSKIELRLNDVIEEKHKVLQAVKVHNLELPLTNTSQSYTTTRRIAPEITLSLETSRTVTPTVLNNQSRLNESILSALNQHGRLLDDRTSALQNSIHELSTTRDNSGNQNMLTQIQEDHTRILQEKQALLAELNVLRTERDNLTHNQTNSHTNEDAHRWQAENRELRRQLDATKDKLSLATTTMTLARSEHVREIQRLQDTHARDSVHVNTHNDVSSQLSEARAQNARLKAALEERNSETNTLIAGSRDEHSKSLQRVEQEKSQLQLRLEATQAMLDEQLTKHKAQLEASARTDRLVRDLYLENAQLMQCLEMSEKRGVKAEKSVYGLEEKCRVLQSVLGNVGASVALV